MDLDPLIYPFCSVDPIDDREDEPDGFKMEDRYCLQKEGKELEFQTRPAS